MATIPVTTGLKKMANRALQGCRETPLMNVYLRTFEKRSVLQTQGDMFDEARFLMKNSLQHSNVPKPLDNLPYRTQIKF